MPWGCKRKEDRTFGLRYYQVCVSQPHTGYGSEASLENESILHSNSLIDIPSLTRMKIDTFGIIVLFYIKRTYNIDVMLV